MTFNEVYVDNEWSSWGELHAAMYGGPPPLLEWNIFTTSIIILYPDDDSAYVCNIMHTLVDTSFSDFFHVNHGVLCCEHAEQAGGGGGGNRLAE